MSSATTTLIEAVKNSRRAKQVLIATLARAIAYGFDIGGWGALGLLRLASLVVSWVELG